MRQTDRSPANVLFVVSSLSVGGTEKHLVSISRALRSRGWNVAVYSTGGDGPLAEDLRVGGVRVISAPPSIGRVSAIGRMFRLPMTALHLLSVLISGRFTVVHFFLPEAYLIGAPLALLAGIKLRIMSRRSLNVYQSKHRLAGFLERRWHSFTTAVLANSHRVARQLELEGVRPDRLGLIYNGLDTEVRARTGRDRVRDALGVSDAALVFVIVANLIPYKGHLDLIESFGRVADQLPADWRLLVVGRDDGVAAAAKALAVSFDISDKISFLGPRSDVPDLLSASDVGLLSSHEEGFSNAVIEGMQAGLPMIVTDVGGNAEAVIDGETGLVVPPRDPSAFANAIVRLASDAQLRRNYGNKGRRRVEQYFTLDGCVAAYEATYLGLLAGKSPSEIAEIRY
jgi:glycosyltransferase involved in cell wall biosynthesis